MEAETTYRITVSEKDTEVLGELIAILDGCPVELSMMITWKLSEQSVLAARMWKRKQSNSRLQKGAKNECV